MKTVSLLAVLLWSLCLVSTASAAGRCCPPPRKEKTDPLQTLLTRLQENTAKMTTCTATLEYLFIQDPDLLDSHTLRTGTLSYLKDDDRSHARIQFDTVKQDDFDAEERLEIYLFDGVWLTKVDYALEQVDRYQQAPEDEPVNAFDFLSHHFPLVGFSGTTQLAEDFEVKRVEAEDDTLTHLELIVQKESRYSKDYTKIDFWIDNALALPRRVRAYATQGDVYDIRFLDIDTEKEIDKQAFAIEKPPHFQKNTEPLNTPPNRKD